MTGRGKLISGRSRWARAAGPVLLVVLLALAWLPVGPVAVAGKVAAAGQVALANPADRLVLITGSDSYTAALVAAYRRLRAEGYTFELTLFNPKHFVEGDTLERLEAVMGRASLVLVEMVSSRTGEILKSRFERLPSSTRILATRSGNAFAGVARVDASEDEALQAYFENGTVENMRRLLLYLVSRHGKVRVTEEVKPVTLPGNFAYHPDAAGTFRTRRDYLDWYRGRGRYREGAPWVGVLTYDSYFKNGDVEMHLALLRSLEAKGANVLLVFAGRDKERAVREFFMEGGRSQVEVLVNATGFTFVYGRPEAGVRMFKELNVPILTPVYASNLDDWETNPAGISGEVYWQVAFPELEGRLEPVLMGGSRVMEVDGATGARVEKKVPLPDRIERLAGIALKWAGLRRKDNRDKRVAIVYYNYAGGKDGITASYLNVEKSLSSILEALKGEGYRLEGGTGSVLEVVPGLEAGNLLRLMLDKGRNAGSWAPGEVETLVRAGAMTLPVEEYLQWFRALPRDLQQQVEKEWGLPPGKVMVHQGRIVIPGIRLGNVFIGPQPLRGWGDDPDKITHSPLLPPTHQYLAFYFWLQRGFQADAVVHLGTHGTLEWLPGKSVGLAGTDWPDLLLGDIPDIYPYIINNPGEGTQAKRRGYALIIDHLTPPMVKPRLYGELAGLRELVDGYRAEAGKAKPDPARLQVLRGQVVEKVKACNLHVDLGLDLDEEFYRLLSGVEEYLDQMAGELMPYGLHTFGRPPAGPLLDQMADAIVDYDPEARARSREDIRDRLVLTSREMKNLLRALRGEYVEPGLGRDPVRSPDALPTGANFYSFDPRLVPDRAAWETGKRLADQLVQNYLAERGEYPSRVGVVLWAIETMRTQGETVAMVLRLAGAEPVWDRSGRVTGVSITPLRELGRPRIDVLVTISGLFRDTFVNLVEVLDEALGRVARAEEPEGDNFLRKHYRENLDYFLRAGRPREEAAGLAAARIFGEPPGTYGTGVAQMVEATSAWGDSRDLARIYLSRMAHVYGKGAYGQAAGEAFRRALGNLEAAVQVRDSLYGVVDNDDVYQYLGGLALAARELSGKEVATYIANTRHAARPRVEPLARFLGTELKTRLFNPVWVEGMLQEGYAGSATVSKHVGYLFGVDATMEAVDDWAWTKVANTFILDPLVKERLNPYAVQSVAGWALEAARREMWKPDRDTLAHLANAYVESVVEYGVVCCHHTCANLVFNQWIARYTSLPGATLARFASRFTGATGEALALPAQARPSGHPRGFQPAVPSAPGTPAGEAGNPRAFEVKAVTPEAGEPGSGPSAVSFYAILGALLGALVFATGYWLAGRAR